jgi:hypothetical protein
MSLNIFETIEEIPQGVEYIKSNDLFFDAKGNIPNSEFAKAVLEHIDNARYFNNKSFIGRFGDDDLQPKSNLSTGSKTLLNIAQNIHQCFNVSECGNNALEMLFRINEGNILWKMPIVWLESDIDCDIMFKGKHYAKAFEFLADTMGRD